MPKIAALLALALAAVALAACGDDNGTTPTDTETGQEAPEEAPAAAGEEGPAAGKGAALELEAVPQEGGLEYTAGEATAKAGEVTIDFTNPQALGHDVAIEGPEGDQLAKTEVISEGSDSASVRLKPGEYTYYCTVPGHREGGMEGTLNVK